MCRTHGRIKDQNLNFYLETHATTRKTKNSAQKLGTLYTGVWKAP